MSGGGKVKVGAAGGGSPTLGAKRKGRSVSGGLHALDTCVQRGRLGIPAAQPERSGGKPLPRQGRSLLAGALRGLPAEGVAENAHFARLERGEGFPLTDNFSETGVLEQAIRLL